ncbi:MAG TPA: acyl carrier protein [Usitatibacter sp.]|nr:acyl carrier protein [Usitatibacter sp.]
MHAPVIRQLIAEHARLPVDVSTLADDADLYQAGLTSLSTVNLMLALEERFDVEFPDRMLGRKTFGSIASLADAIGELTGHAMPAPHRSSPLLGAA